MAQGDPKLPDIPGYTARYTGAPAIPTPDTYSPMAQNPLARQFASFSDTLTKAVAIQNTKKQEEDIAKGKAWRLQSQKTFRQAVLDGDIDPTQNPWFSVGAMETDGKMGSKQFTSDVLDGWTAIANDETDPRSRDPEGFEIYYKEQLEKFAEENQVDSHYWANSFFESTQNWYTQSNPGQSQASRARLYKHETNKSLVAIESSLAQFITDPSNSHIKDAQELIDSLYARGMWTQETRDTLAQRLYSAVLKSDDPETAEKFIKALKRGPVDAKSRPGLATDDYFRVHSQRQRSAIDDQAEDVRLRNLSNERIQLNNDMGFLFNFRYREANPDGYKRDDGTLVSWDDLSKSVLTRLQDSNLYDEKTLEQLLSTYGVSLYDTVEAAERLRQQNEESKDFPIEVLNERAAFRAKISRFSDPLFTLRQAKESMDPNEWAAMSQSEQFEAASEWTKAAAEQAERELSEMIGAGKFKKGTTIESILTDVKTSRDLLNARLARMIDEDIPKRQAASALVGTQLERLTQLPFAMGSAEQPVVDLDAELSKMFMRPGFSEAARLTGLSKADLKLLIQEGQAALIAGTIDPTGVSVSALNAVFESADLDAYVLKDRGDGSYVNDKGQDPTTAWSEMVRMATTYYDSPNPHLTRQLEDMVIEQMRQVERIPDDQRQGDEFMEQVKNMRAMRVLELAYEMQGESPGRTGVDDSSYILSPGGGVLETYSELRKHLPMDVAYEKLLREGITKPINRIPTDKEAQKAFGEQLSNMGLPATMEFSTPTERNQGIVVNLFNQDVAGEMQAGEDTPGLSPLSNQHYAMGRVNERALVDPQGTMYAAKVPASLSYLKGIKDEGLLDEANLHILRSLFPVSASDVQGNLALQRQLVASDGVSPVPDDMLVQDTGTTSFEMASWYASTSNNENWNLLAIRGLNHEDIVMVPQSRNNSDEWEHIVLYDSKNGAPIPLGVISRAQYENAFDEWSNTEYEELQQALPLSEDEIPSGWFLRRG